MSDISIAPQSGSDAELYAALSHSRMKPYLRATNQHRKNAIALYRWNMGISGAFYQGLHVFEVALRNSMDARLRAWNARQVDDRGHPFDAEWCRRPDPLLARILGADPSNALDRAEKELQIKGLTRSPTHDDIVAQLNLGTWRFLLPSHSDAGKAQIWQDELSGAFPYLTRPLQQLIDAVDGVYGLRNRIAHLEPLIGTNLEAQYRNMQTVLGDIEPRVRDWFVNTSPIRSILDRRPIFE